MMMQFEIPKERPSIIKVIGVGGGGSNAVNHMFRLGIKGVDFMICNTDHQALEMSPVPVRVQLGPSLTDGRGAGSIPEIGKNAAIENIEEVRALLAQNTKMVFITAGMGGGTGTGAAPIIAGLAKEMGILTVAIVTVPFSFEGKKRKAQADLGIEELKKNVDTLLVICNDRLREIHGNLKLTDAFVHADDVLAIAAKSIAETITKTLHINVDFADVQTVLRESGVAIMGSASAEGEDRALSAIMNALDSPLLNDNNIEGARYILLNITSGTTEVTMDELGQITDFIQEQAGNSAEVIMGVGTDETLGPKVGVTVIATGFKTKDQLSNVIPEKKEKVVYKLMEDIVPAAEQPAIVQPVVPVRELRSTIKLAEPVTAEKLSFNQQETPRMGFTMPAPTIEYPVQAISSPTPVVTETKTQSEVPPVEEIRLETTPVTEIPVEPVVVAEVSSEPPAQTATPVAEVPVAAAPVVIPEPTRENTALNESFIPSAFAMFSLTDAYQVPMSDFPVTETQEPVEVPAIVNEDDKVVFTLDEVEPEPVKHSEPVEELPVMRLITPAEPIASVMEKTEPEVPVQEKEAPIVFSLITPEEKTASAETPVTPDPMEPVLMIRETAVVQEEENTFVFDVNSEITAPEAAAPEVESLKPVPEAETIAPFKRSVPPVESTPVHYNPPTQDKDLEAADSEENSDAFLRARARIMQLRELSMKMNSSNGLADLEKEPAYKRRNVQLNNLPEHGDPQISRYTLTNDADNKPEIRPNNPFLHDRVD
jgi:cell division protein FtsZ